MGYMMSLLLFFIKFWLAAYKEDNKSYKTKSVSLEPFFA